ncbi:MAG: nucleotidyltransferase domain-containing protein [Flavobacteriales bacterium]|nr:nucleotidyltransferase domain-containing protein [Flavobacteriales bacterium]
MDFFAPYMEQIAALCKKHDVKSLYAFGSAARGDMNPRSDVDLLVDIKATDPIAYGELYFSLRFGLEDLLGRKVDLLEARAAHNPFFLQAIEPSKRGLYAG